MSTLLTNGEVVAAAGLPADTVTKLATAQGSEFQATMNQFLTAIVNKIVYQKVESMQFSNPFKKYDSYPVNYGDTIENLFVDMPDGYVFNKDATDPFAKKQPKVLPLYASINYEMQYQTTIQDVLIRRCALKEYGFMEIINSILSTLVTKRSVDEYIATIRMLNNANIYAGGFESFTPEGTSEPEKYKSVTMKLVNVVHDFLLPSADNNKAGVMQVSTPSNLLIIMKQSLLDSINIQYLTGVFNLNKIDIGSQIMTVRSFVTGSNTMTGENVTTSAPTGEDLDFIVIDTRGFDNHVALEDGGTIYNPKGKYTNHFTNLWKIISFKYWYQARAFKLA